MALEVGTNSYVTQAEADAYFNDSLRKADWKDGDGATRAAALVEAFRYMARLKFIGTPTVEGQAGHFPATGIAGVASDEVPSRIKDAQIEIAIRLKLDPTAIDAINDQTTSNIKRIKAEGVEIENFAPTTGSALFAWVNSSIRDLLGGASAQGGFGGATSAGTCLEHDANFGSDTYGVGTSFL